MVIKETLNHMFTDPHQFNHILNAPLIMLDKNLHLHTHFKVQKGKI